MSPTQWVRPEWRIPSRFDATDPIQYFVGIGTIADTLALIEKLASDPRMVDVWPEIQKLENEARSGRIKHVFHLNDEIVSCAIAERCALAVSNDAEIVTRAAWSERHKNISHLAKELSALLAREPVVDEGFHNVSLLFNDEDLHDIATEYHFNTRPTDFDRVEKTFSGMEESPEEIAADDAKWDEEVKSVAYWMKYAMERSAVSTSELLMRMSEMAEIVARNPPFLPPVDTTQRQVFNISGSLFRYFQHHFARPLDEVVATIASVVTELEVTADSVKMRRQRWREHYTRPLR
jgi:hypothetical protein